MTGARSPADIHDRSDRQHRERDALEQAERAGQFMQQQLRPERHSQDQGYGIEAERVEGDGECAGHVNAQNDSFNVSLAWCR